MKLRISKTQLVVLFSLWGVLSFANDCDELMDGPSVSAPQETLLDVRPQPPDGVEIIEQTEAFTIYKVRDGVFRILFDTRKAETAFVTDNFGESHQTSAMINPDTGRVFVNEGRHRAVEASQGYVVDERLNGTTHLYWLDYSLGKSLEIEGYEVRPLTSVNIVWGAGSYEHYDPDKRVLFGYR